MAGARVSGWRCATGRRRMVAPRLFEANGGVDGAGRSWPNELPPPGSASGSVYEERRMDDSGQAAFYATAMPRRTGAIPLVVTTHDGRPTKIDGNPLHPTSGGASDTFAQASILDLYDPTRSQRFIHNGKTSDRAAFEAYITQLHKTLLVQQGDSLAFLVEETHSPTRERLRAELEKIFPRLRWIVYEPLLSEAQSFATELSFGGNLRVVPKLDRADVILALDSDFLDCGQGDLASVRAF